MAMSKSDLLRNSRKTANRIAELEKKARLDPLRKHPEIHEELEKLRKSLQ